MQHPLPPLPRGALVVISGPSGAGKTTIARAVESHFPTAYFSISATTRQPTPADRPDIDYHFLNNQQFDELVAANAFLEHATFAGNRYGTLREPVLAALDDNRLVILEIDVQGGIAVKAQMPASLGIFILPPSDEALLTRLRARRREPEEAIQRRFAQARHEIVHARDSGAYDHFITNDNLDRAIHETIATINARLAPPA